MSAPRRRKRKPALWVRSLHIYGSLVGLLALLLFACSGFLLHHSDWFESPPEVIEESFTIPPGLEGLEAVSQLRARGVKGLLGAFSKEGQRLDLSFERPGETSEVLVDLSSGRVTIRRERRGLVAALGEVHTGKTSGTLGGLLLDAVALLLIALSASGLYLWASLPKRRRLGLLLIAGSGLAFLALILYWS